MSLRTGIMVAGLAAGLLLGPLSASGAALNSCSGNRPPVARFTVNGAPLPADLRVNATVDEVLFFDGAVSVDQGGTAQVAEPQAATVRHHSSLTVRHHSLDAPVHQAANRFGTGWITAWHWDFNRDGLDDSTSESFSHAFDATGIYEVTLWVEDNCGSNSLAATVEINVQAPGNPCATNAPPVAQATVSVNGTALRDGDAVSVGDAVLFDGLASSDNDGSIALYDWDFGDGTVGTGPSVPHTYTGEATFTVVLKVTDTCGATATDTLYIDHGATRQRPIAPDVNDSVTFSLTGTPQANEFYYWEFSDGVNTFDPEFTRRFQSAGTYSVTLTIYDATTWAVISTHPRTVVVAPGLFLERIWPGDTGINMGLAVVNGHAWVGDTLGRIRTVDVGNAGATPVGQQLYGSIADISASTNLVAVAAGYGGVYLFDAEGVATDTPLGHYSTLGSDGYNAHSVALAGSKLYVAGVFSSGGGQVRVLDTADVWSQGGQPRLLSTTSDVGCPARVVAAGRHLYVGDAVAHTLYVVDATDPASPELQSSVALRERALDMCVSGPLLVVVEREYHSGTFQGTLALFEILPSGDLVFRSRLGNGGSVYRGVAGEGAWIYATDSGCVREIDVSDPGAPFVHGSAGANGYIPTLVRTGPDGTVYCGVDSAALAAFRP